MSSSNMFLTVHHWGALLCVPIGLSLNLLLLWLILKCTPKEMWVHSRVLLQTCGIDFVQIAVLAAGGYTVCGFFVALAPILANIFIIDNQ
jgi:hypothetical protein